MYKFQYITLYSTIRQTAIFKFPQAKYSIFSKLGILKKGTFRKVTRSDLIAGYLGQTAIKTRDVVKEALGGVLFIDEAYALGNSEKRDSFAKYEAPSVDSV